MARQVRVLGEGWEARLLVPPALRELPSDLVQIFAANVE
jgi:hypothetical protein